MGLGLHSCGMWPIHKLIEARLFETTGRFHLEGYNISSCVCRTLNQKNKQFKLCMPSQKKEFDK
jgi:hypothetical protein